jgi:DNA polymerase
MVRKLHIDLETRSAVNLKTAGLYVYAADKTTDVWVASYAVDDGEVKRWIPGQPVPQEIVDAVNSGMLIFAHNAQFERDVWREILTPRYGWPLPALEQFRCTMVMALAMALPASLEKLAPALGLDAVKDMKGHALMMRMAQPRKPRRKETAEPDANGLLWYDDAERREKLYAYCDQDVETERAAERRLLPLSESEQRLWQLDQRINDRGMGVDFNLATAAAKVVKDHTAKLNRELKELTGGAVFAGTNVDQIKAWLLEHGVETDSLDKEAVSYLLTREAVTSTPMLTRALEIRREVGKASVTKINALLRGRNDDGRARGLLQFHAASTGRWGGRRFQPHNLKRPTIKDIPTAISLVALGDAEAVELAYGDPLSVVGDTLRGMVRAAHGNILLASDFSNIEGRGLAWLAGEQWKLDAFREFDAGVGPDLYKLSYSRALGVPIESVDDFMRQVGKVIELALGYEGGVGAFQTMASGYGVKVSDAEADVLKNKWRQAHPMTKLLWRSLIDAAVEAVASPGTIVIVNNKLQFLKRGSFLFMRLPSGRVLVYPYARVVQMVWVENKLTGKRSTLPLSEAKETVGVEFEVDAAFSSVVYQGIGAYKRKWGPVYLYGGMLAENAVQALSRDVLAEAMSRVDSAGYPIVLTVHDEIVAEVPRGGAHSFEEFNSLMQVVPAWAMGFPIVAAGWTGERYRK